MTSTTFPANPLHLQLGTRLIAGARKLLSAAAPSLRYRCTQAHDMVRFPYMDSSLRLHDLLGEFSTAMLVTHNGYTLRARPMAIARVDDACNVSFITSRESGKCHEIAEDTHVSVICQKGHSAFLSVSGSASLDTDRLRIESLWRESFKVWFPKGRTDPGIALIHVRPHQAEYWDHRGFHKVEYLLREAGAYFSGNRPEADEPEAHGVVSL